MSKKVFRTSCVKHLFSLYICSLYIGRSSHQIFMVAAPIKYSLFCHVKCDKLYMVARERKRPALPFTPLIHNFGGSHGN